MLMPVGDWRRHPSVNIDIRLLYCIPKFNPIQSDGRGQSSPDNYSKLMDTTREYHGIYDKTLREYKDQRIKKNAWQ